jgi:transglutaminase-like putative cysteine protease
VTVRARYRVEHETRYVHTTSVSTSQHVACLRPRELPRQHVARSAIVVEPAPTQTTRRVDYFGNAVDQFTVLGPYAELRVVGRSLVEVSSLDPWPDPALSPPWEEAAEALVYRKGDASVEPAQYAYASHYVSPDGDLVAFARESFPPRRPLLEGAVDLTRRIHAEFRFDASATTLTTPVRRVLAERRGVCQDFAHLQIACMRGLGLAARYVSGYILTDPPPGQERLAGADASHAWVGVFCPRFGWIDLDPTNNLICSDRHVTVAWGRDYADVSPLHGIILGGEEHELRVGVSVIPLDEEEWIDATRETAAG